MKNNFVTITQIIQIDYTDLSVKSLPFIGVIDSQEMILIYLSNLKRK